MCLKQGWGGDWSTLVRATKECFLEEAWEWEGIDCENIPGRRNSKGRIFEMEERKDGYILLEYTHNSGEKKMLW